jgi:hypothetical protein
MKNLKSAMQLSFMIFALICLSCERDADAFVPGTIEGEQLKTNLTREDGDFTPPIFLPVDQLRSGLDYKYLTLLDESGRNGIVVKVKTSNPELLNSLTSETIEFFTLKQELPVGVEAEKLKDVQIADRSLLKPVEFEVIEARVQSSVKFYGIQFVNPKLIRANGTLELIYKNSRVRAAHITGPFVLNDRSRFSAQSVICSECGTQDLAPHFSVAKSRISYYSTDQTNMIIHSKQQFSDNIKILW